MNFDKLFVVSLDTTAWIGNVGHAAATLLAFLFVVEGYKNLEPSIAGIIGLLEVPFGILLGIVLFGEKLTESIVIGGGLILVATMIPNIKEAFYDSK